MPWAFRSSLASQNHTTYTTSHPHRMDSKSAGALRGRIDRSTIELGGAESWKGVDEWGGSEEGHGREVWDTKSAELDDENRARSL